MNDKDLLDKQIENYIHNRMPDAERIEFEKALKNNPELRTNVIELLTLKLLYNKELLELKQKLDAVENELKQENFSETSSDE